MYKNSEKKSIVDSKEASIIQFALRNKWCFQDYFGTDVKKLSMRDQKS